MTLLKVIDIETAVAFCKMVMKGLKGHKHQFVACGKYYPNNAILTQPCRFPSGNDIHQNA